MGAKRDKKAAEKENVSSVSFPTQEGFALMQTFADSDKKTWQNLERIICKQILSRKTWWDQCEFRKL